MNTLDFEFAGPTPQIVTHDAQQAINFYREAFAADELVRNNSPDGRVMHCELLIFGGRMLVIDDFDEDHVSSPARLGGSTVRLHVYVPEVDTVYQRALDAGATAVMPPIEAFWGDRYAIIQDPCGHYWSIATPHEDLSVADQEKRADAWSEQHRRQP